MREVKIFDNGIRLIHEYIPNSKVFTVLICAMVGSNDEKEDEYGLAHLLEHMTFKSTQKRSSAEINQFMDKLGGNFNAYTANESTVFYLTTSIYNAKDALECFCDIFTNTTWRQDELEKEKQVVCSEIKMYEDDFPNVSVENLIVNAFDNMPMKHIIIGNSKNVMATNTDKLQEFKKKHYTPGKIIVSTAGGVKVDEVIKYLEEYLIPKYDKKEKPYQYTTEYLQCVPKQDFVFQSKDADQAYCNMSLPSVNKSSKDTITNTIFNLILGGCMSSRLFTEVREKEGLVYHIGCDTENFSMSGINIIRFFCNENNIEKTFGVIKKVLDDIKQNGFTSEELERAKSILITAKVIHQEKTSSIAMQNLESYMFKGEMFDIDSYIAKIQDIKLEELNAFIQSVIDYNKITFSVVAKNNVKNPNKIFNQ